MSRRPAAERSERGAEGSELTRSPSVVPEVLREQAGSLKSPPMTAKEAVGTLERCGLARFSEAIGATGALS